MARRKSILIRGYTMYVPDGNQQLVECWEQPLWHWLKATVYHWYDMRVYKLPGFKQLENWLWEPHRGDWQYVPLSCRQDERCYHLMNRNRKVVASFTITIDSSKLA